MIIVPVFIITLVLNLANFLSGVDVGQGHPALFNFAEGSPLIGKSILVPMLVMAGFRLSGRPRRSGRRTR